MTELGWLVLVIVLCTVALGYGFVMLGNVLNKGFDEILSELRRRE